MPLPLVQHRWLFPAVIAAVALGLCASGLAPCAIAKPIGIVAASAAALLVAVEDDPATSVG